MRSTSKLTEHQKDVLHRGIGEKYEKRGKRWLRDRKFMIQKEWPSKHNDPYDVIAMKDGRKWIIEIKGGETGKVRLANLVRMYQEHGADMLGLLFVMDEKPYYLFELPKKEIAGLLSSLKKGKKGERRAARKASRARRSA